MSASSASEIQRSLILLKCTAETSHFVVSLGHNGYCQRYLCHELEKDSCYFISYLNITALGLPGK